MSMLLGPKLRRHFARIALERPWVESLLEAHWPSEARDVAIERHQHEVRVIEQSLASFLAKNGLSGRASDPRALATELLPVDPISRPGLVAWF